MYAVTGITGKVGGAVARTLLSAGQQLRAVVRDAKKGKSWLFVGWEKAESTDFGLVQGLINWRPQQVSGTGKVVVKQSDFGIEPVSAAGGLVQVEDDVTVTFRIVAEREERELPQIRTGLSGRTIRSHIHNEAGDELARAHARRHGCARSESWCDGSSASAV